MISAGSIWMSWKSTVTRKRWSWNIILDAENSEKIVWMNIAVWRNPGGFYVKNNKKKYNKMCETIL